MKKEVQFVLRALTEQWTTTSVLFLEHNPAVHYVAVLCLSSLDL